MLIYAFSFMLKLPLFGWCTVNRRYVAFISELVKARSRKQLHLTTIKQKTAKDHNFGNKIITKKSLRIDCFALESNPISPSRFIVLIMLDQPTTSVKSSSIFASCFFETI